MEIFKASKLAILCGALLGGLILFTQPDQLPSVMLTVPYILLFILFFILFKRVFGGLGITRKKGVSLMALVAGLPVFLLALQSLGQLTSRDIIMVLVLFLIAYFYLYKRARSRSA